jgi:hypothetical protein
MNSITGSAGIDTITGTVADDEIFSGDDSDFITGGAGNDVIYGGKGTDTVSYSGRFSSFRFTALYEGKNSSFSGYNVTDLYGSEGTDIVSSDVEYLTFSSGSVIYKIDNGTLILVDTTAPTISIESSASSLSASQTASLTFTLSESSANFDASDVTVSGGTLSNFSGSGTTYTALFTPTANSTTNGVIRVGNTAFTDAAGNPNADGSDSNNILTLPINTVTTDTTAPTIAITSSATSLSGYQTASLTFTLSESSTNFNASDVTVSGGTLSNFSGSGTTYTALFTPTANSTINGVVSVVSGTFSDAAGNTNADGSDTNNVLTFSRIPTISNETHTLTVLVDKNILGPSAILLKDLSESITYTDGVITKHIVEYSGSTFDYDQIDSLITTVIRGGYFTAEFTREINDYLGTELNITYSAAVLLVGVTNIDAVILAVAGADGNYVG